MAKILGIGIVVRVLIMQWEYRHLTVRVVHRSLNTRMGDVPGRWSLRQLRQYTVAFL